MGSFLFNDEEVFKKIGVLSGGEKSRVALAKILLTKANLIVLDEPTNHLDMTSKEILQKALQYFSGSLILVSHDVDFIRPIVSKVIEIRPNFFKVYEGGIDYYFEKRQEYLETIEKAEAKESAEEKPNNNLSKKEQKRLEAELRQKKYSETKNLIKRVEEVEKEIENLEDKKQKLEEELADPKIFSKPDISKTRNQEYKEVKDSLEEYYTEWTDLQEKLEEVEKKYSTS